VPKKRVLFIDSDNAFVEQWAGIIEKSGVEVIKNQDGSAGLVLAKTYQPNLIVLGLELRDMNGYLVCKRLREDAGTKSIPLFVTSSTADEKDFAKHKKLRVRADEYFRKPVDENAFKEKLSVMLGVQLASGAAEVIRSVPLKTVDDAEVVALKDRVKAMEVEIELLKKDLEDAHNSRKELAKSLGAQLDIEREKNRQLQDENESLKEQIKILTRDKQELSKIIDKFESEKRKREAEYREKLNDYEGKIREFERIKLEFERSEREKEKYKTEISQFRGELTKFKDRVVELEEIVKEKDKELSQVDALSDRAKELEERIAVLTNEKEKIEADLKEAQSQNNTEITALMDQINNFSAEKSKLESELNETRIKIEELQRLLKEKEGDFERAMSEKQTLEETLKNKDTTISEKEAIILELDQKVESQLSVIKDTEKQLKEKEELVEKLNQRLLQIEAEIEKGDGLKERVKALESQIAEKEEELLRFRGISERINELESELNSAKSREEELKRRLFEMEELRKKDEEFLNTLDRVVKEKDELFKRVKELEEERAINEGARNAELEQEVLSLKAQLTEKEQEIKNLKELVDVQMEEKAALEKELKALKELKESAEGSREVVSSEGAPEEIIELVEEKREQQKEEVNKEELLVLDESTVVKQSDEAKTEESDLVSMLDNIWEDSKGPDAIVEGEKPKEEFFEEGEVVTAGAEEKDGLDQESMEWTQLINQYNDIFNLIFLKLVPEKGKEPAQAIWEEFLSEQDEKERIIFENVNINDDGTLSTLEIVKNLKKINEGGKIGKIAGLDSLYVNQKLKSKLSEFIDFMIIIAKKKLDKSDSENLIKTIKEKQKSIK
jgi:DNA-binding response OmpR family regulator